MSRATGASCRSFQKPTSAWPHQGASLQLQLEEFERIREQYTLSYVSSIGTERTYSWNYIGRFKRFDEGNKTVLSSTGMTHNELVVYQQQEKLSEQYASHEVSSVVEGMQYDIFRFSGKIRERLHKQYMIIVCCSIT